MPPRAHGALQLLPRLGLTTLAAAVVLSAPGAAAASSGCDRVAAPSGSDSAAGTDAAPFRSVKQLVDSLAAGQTGCLRAGSYGGPDLQVKQPGSVLQSYPGERATLTSFIEVYPEAQGARISGLHIDASANGNQTGVKLQADGAVFSSNSLTKGGKGICLVAGSFNDARNVLIERNHIYDCGPNDSKFDHQLYLVHTRGAIVRQNILNGNAGGWGVHLYTDADNTLIEHNVIDGNRGGVIFAGDGGETSDGNVVRNNALTFNGPRWNVEGSWSGGPTGSGNSAHDNCVYSTGQDAPAGIAGPEGFSASGNAVLSGSPYANRAAGDYRFRADSPCASLVGNVAGAAVGSAPVAASSARGAKLSLRSRKRRVRSNIALSGRMVGRPAKGSRVALQVRSHGRWRTVARKRLHGSGRFAARLRANRFGRARTLRIRAVVKGVARSRTLRVRVLR